MKKMGGKLLITITVLVILASATIASASNGGTHHFIPYIGGPDFYASVGDVIYIRARWGACTYGLTKVFTKQANITLEMDGTPLVTSRKEAKAYWADPAPTTLGDISDCLINTDTIYLSYWDYPIGSLGVGDYEFHFVYRVNHPFPDGGDYDNDGKLDLFEIYIEEDFTIHVE